MPPRRQSHNDALEGERGRGGGVLWEQGTTNASGERWRRVEISWCEMAWKIKREK